MPQSDHERIKLYSGWTFVQWAFVAAFMHKRVGLPPPDVDGLDKVQAYWRERMPYGLLPPRFLNMGLPSGKPPYFAWAWACAALAHAAETCKRLGTYRLDPPPPT